MRVFTGEIMRMWDDLMSVVEGVDLMLWYGVMGALELIHLNLCMP
jgi:hypothetical protein